MENSEKYNHIKGWGVDADPKNDPTYPMKNFTGDDHKRLNYDRPSQQKTNIEVLHSNERPGVSAVFGTSVPPAGVSGSLRRKAFAYSEGNLAHWLLLLLADRIDVVEAVIEDLKKGVVPNFFEEAGGRAAWKYNRKGVLRKIVIAALISLFAMILFSGSGKKR